MRLKTIAICTLLVCSHAAFADPQSVSKIVDDEVNATLQAKQITPSPRASDAELLRRLCLDVIGRIPTLDETERFLNDESPDKHHRLIDQLLSHDEMPIYWAVTMDEWFNGNLLEREFGADGFINYLGETIEANTPWNVIAREMLVPNVKDKRQHGAAYFLAVRLRGSDKSAKLDAMTSGVASVFFGVQLQCAKCHDHPFVDQWKQDHYYGLAAFLGRTQEVRMGNTPFIKERADGEVTFVTTAAKEKTARLVFLDGREFDEPKPPEDRNKWYTKGSNGSPEVPYYSRRQTLADYALNAKSEFFKRAIVNRVWKQLMGRGLVEPVDQMNSVNPASHPELLTRLADDFANNGFDLKRLIAGILRSDAYQRSSRWDSGKRPADVTYAAAIVKPLSASQLVTSVAIATGKYRTMQQKLEREKGKRKIEEVTPAIVRQQFARDREVREFAAMFKPGGEGFQANSGQALFLTYNSSMQKQLQPSQGNLIESLLKNDDDIEVTKTVYLKVLSRPPSDEEVQIVTGSFAAADSRSSACQEVVWALLCGNEFRFNH